MDNVERKERSFYLVAWQRRGWEIEEQLFGNQFAVQRTRSMQIAQLLHDVVDLKSQFAVNLYAVRRVKFADVRVERTDFFERARALVAAIARFALLERMTLGQMRQQIPFLHKRLRTLLALEHA